MKLMSNQKSLAGWQGFVDYGYMYFMEQHNEHSLSTFSHLLKDSEAAPKMATSFTPQSS